MNYKELYSKVEDNYYKSKLPYPPYRENLKEREKEYNADGEMKMAYRNDDLRLKKLFKSDLKQRVEQDVGFVITDEQFAPFYSFAYEIGHSGGYSEILNYAGELIDVVKPFVEARKA